MKSKIGNVVLDYRFYNENMHYSDGIIEETLLRAAKNDQLEELLYSSKEWAVLYHCSDIRENLLEWYPFKKEGSLLEIGSGCGALTGLFSRKVRSVTCIELSERRSMINAYRNKACDNIRILLGSFQDIKIEEKFDYITLIGVWEYAGQYVKGDNPWLQMLNILKPYLKEDGTLLIALENKMGLKYWNGAVEDHTGRMYSGLNDYVDVKFGIRTFSRPEIQELLCKAGLEHYKFYYPLPDYKLPEVIYSDERLPQPGEIRDYRKDYTTTRIYNFYDATVCDQLCVDQMFQYFANSFLVECGFTTEDVIYAKYSRNRKKEYQTSTVIRKKGDSYIVEKKALKSEAQKHIESMERNTMFTWGALCPLKGCYQDGSYIVPYLDGKDMDTCFYQYRNNAEQFIAKIREIIQTYLRPDESAMFDFQLTEEYRSLFGEKYVPDEKCLKYSNLDINLSNIRHTEDEKMYFIDQEWVYDFPIPYEYIIWRVANQLYINYAIYLKKQISKIDYLTAIGIKQEHSEVYQEMEKNFLDNIYGRDYRDNYKKQAIMYDVHLL